jgi:ribonuclease D
MNRNLSEVNEKKKTAALRWGESRKQPHPLYSGMLEYRVNLNLSLPTLLHPFAEEVKNWTILKEQLNVSEVPKAPRVVWIHQLGELANLKEEIVRHPQLSLCYKECVDCSFLGMISLLLIYVNNTSYIVDCFRLYNAIKSILGGVLSDPRVLIVVFDESVIPKIQRDFDVYLVGVVLCIEVYQYFIGNKDYVPSKSIVMELCHYSREDLVCYADWGTRPLHSMLIKEAGMECYHLMKSWNILKQKLGNSLLMFEFERSKGSCLALYSQPSPFDSNEIFDQINNSLSEDVSKIFCVTQQKNLFEKLLLWRSGQSRNNDYCQERFVPNEKLGVICRAMPMRRDSVVSLLPDARTWKLSQIESLIEVIRKAQIPQSIPVIISKRVKVEESQTWENVNYGNLVIIHHPSVEVPPRVSRSRLRRQLLRRQNANRIAQGLPALSIRRNRTTNDLERSRLRALLFRLEKEGL